MVSFFYVHRVWFGQTTRRSIFVQQKAHEGVAALRNSTVRCFSDSNGHLPREFEPDKGSHIGQTKKLSFQKASSYAIFAFFVAIFMNNMQF